MIEAKTEIGFCTGMTPHAATDLRRDAALKQIRAVLLFLGRRAGGRLYLDKGPYGTPSMAGRGEARLAWFTSLLDVQQEATAVLAASPGCKIPVRGGIENPVACVNQFAGIFPKKKLTAFAMTSR